MEEAFAGQDLSSSSTSSSSESEMSDHGGRHGHHKGKHGARGGHFHGHGKHKGKGKCGHRHKGKFGHLHSPSFPWVSVQSGIAPGFGGPRFPHPMGGGGPRGPPHGPPHQFAPPHGSPPHGPPHHHGPHHFGPPHGPPHGPPPHGPPHHHGHRGPPGHPSHGGPGPHRGGMGPFAPPRDGPPEIGLSVNITAQKEAYNLLGEAAGFEKSHVEITVSNSVLTIKGELPKKDDNGACARTLVEECCFPRKFSRSFKLPEDVELDKVKAEVKHGLLRVVLPRKPGPEPTVIPVGGTDGEEGFVDVVEGGS